MIDLRGQLLTVTEVAAYVNKCTKTVRRWIKSGRLRASGGGGQWLVHPDDLERFLHPDTKTDWLAPFNSINPEG
jgi:excisionase family DNA binding protein